MFKKTLIASAILAMSGAAFSAAPITIDRNWTTAIVDRANNLVNDSIVPAQSQFKVIENVTITNDTHLQALQYIALNADVDLGDNSLTLNFKKNDITYGPVRNVYFHGGENSVLTLNNIAEYDAGSPVSPPLGGSALGCFKNFPTKVKVGTLNLSTNQAYGAIYTGVWGPSSTELSVEAHSINIKNTAGNGVDAVNKGANVVFSGVKNLNIEAQGVGIKAHQGNFRLDAEAGAQLKVTGGLQGVSVLDFGSSLFIHNAEGTTVITATAADGEAVAIGKYREGNAVYDTDGGANGGGLIGGNGKLTIDSSQTLLDGAVLAYGKDSSLNLLGETTVTGDIDVEGTLGAKGNINLGGEVNRIAVLAAAPQTPTVRTFALRSAAPASAPEAVTLTITNPKSRTTIEDNRTTLTVEATGDVNDAAGGIDGFVGTNGMFRIGASTAGGSARVTMAEGLVEGAVTAELNKDGSVNESTVVEKVNSVQEATLNLTTALPITISRALTNDVRKRLGDIRSAEGTHGVWARYDGGKMSAGSDFDHKFHTIQVGADTEPTPDSVRFGVAFSYTTGDTEFARGSSDMDAFSLAAYGTWLGDNGLFADVIGRIATVKNDMTVEQYKGKTDNTVLALSGELGWRWDATDLIYVEPAAELTYTYIDGDKFKLGYADYETDSVDSLVGRAGFALGIKCPNKKGDAYVRVAAVHEFLGDSKVTARGGSSINTAEFDGKDTWVEYAVGASYNITPNTYVWADIERTSGAEVDEDIRGTVGIRYSF